MHRILPLLLLLLAGCANSIDGEVDGYEPNRPRDAIFTSTEIDVFGIANLKMAALLLTNMEQACDGYQALESVSTESCEQSCEDLMAIDVEYLNGDDLWALLVYFASWDDWVGDYAYLDLTAERTFIGSLFRTDVSALDDLESCVADCESSSAADTWNKEATGGVFTLETYEPNDLAEGSFNLSFDSDDLEGSFSADWCE